MKIIGITGGIGAGKSTVSREFGKLGAAVVDSDAISRNVTKKGGKAYGEIADFFGEEFLLEDGELDRRKIAKEVFSNGEKLNALNSITHKHIFAEMEKEIASAASDVAVLDVPLLFTSEFPFDCDLKIAVLADEDIRIKRVMERDNLSEAEIRARIANQIGDEEYKRLADICIINNDINHTRDMVREIFESVRG